MTKLFYPNWAQETFVHKGAFEIKETQQNSIILRGSLRAQE
jgi:hypothetical protein